MNAKEASNWISQRGGEGLEQLNKVAKSRGVDLDEQLAKLGLSGQGGGREGYGQVGQAYDRAEGGNLTPHGGGAGGRDDDFFEVWDEPEPTRPTAQASAPQTKPAQPKKKDDWNDDEWKDF